MCGIAGILKLDAPTTAEDHAAVRRMRDRQSRYGLSLTANERDGDEARLLEVEVECGDFGDAVFLHERNRGAIRETPQLISISGEKSPRAINGFGF